jgi:hypothetical protein
MKSLQNKLIVSLINVDKKVFFIDRCTHLVEDFFTKNLVGCVVNSDAMCLTYENVDYDIVKLEEVGVVLQRDIEIYKLVPICNTFQK